MKHRNHARHPFAKALILLVSTIGLAACSSSDAEKTPGNYIVVLKAKSVKDAASGDSQATAKTAVAAAATNLESRTALEPAQKLFSNTIKAGVYYLNKYQIAAVEKDDAVAYIEKDQKVTISATESPATWGLDRIDQASLPLDQTYHYDSSGTPVNAYVIDTGILISHHDFNGRAFTGVDIVNPGGNAVDCNGHGTHVAGTIGSTTYGVAKNVKLFAVRVLDCQGSGQFSDVIAGIEWVAAHHVSPAVANMSLGGGASQAIDDAIAAAVQSGVTFAVAAGNEDSDACQTSPARSPLAITVGATNSTDSRSSFSNTGPCVTLFAPGEDITSLWIGSTTSTNTISGTSMASPHVAGVAALYLAKNPTATPAQVKAALVAGALSNKVSDRGNGSPNLLLNSTFVNDGNWNGGNPNPQPTPTPTPSPTPSPSPTPTPAPSPTPGVPVLKTGQSVRNLSGAIGSNLYYAVDLPPGVTKLTVTLSGGDGDADLYLQSGSKPTLDEYLCRPYLYGNNESCSVSRPRAGRYYVMVNAFDPFSGATLTVKYK